MRHMINCSYHLLLFFCYSVAGDLVQMVIGVSVMTQIIEEGEDGMKLIVLVCHLLDVIQQILLDVAYLDHQCPKKSKFYKYIQPDI